MKLLLLPLLLLSLLPKLAFAEVSPSILLFNIWDFNSCEIQMQKAIDLGAKTINIVPTIKFIAHDATKLEYFCYQKNFCDKFDREVIAEVENDLKKCATIAARAGVNLSFTPHIDDGGGRGIWRNNLVFDPRASYQETTYKESILDPIYRIIKSLTPVDIEIDFSFQGEMGATVFNYPNSYRQILKEYRKGLGKKVKLGISINYNALGGWGHRYRGVERRTLQKLINEVDFLGFSFYHPVEKKIEDHFSFGTKKFLWELKNKSLKLPENLPLHFTEIGLGGGNLSNDGRSRGNNAFEIGKAPYAGLYSSFNAQTSPWEISQNAIFRREFYNSLNNYLNSEFISNPVTRAFVWNADSWDVFGLYSGTEGYSDQSIIDLLFSNRSL